MSRSSASDFKQRIGNAALDLEVYLSVREITRPDLSFAVRDAANPNRAMPEDGRWPRAVDAGAIGPRIVGKCLCFHRALRPQPLRVDAYAASVHQWRNGLLTAARDLIFMMTGSARKTSYKMIS